MYKRYLGTLYFKLFFFLLILLILGGSFRYIANFFYDQTKSIKIIEIRVQNLKANFRQHKSGHYVAKYVFNYAQDWIRKKFDFLGLDKMHSHP